MRGRIETVRLAIAGCGAISASIHLPNLADIAGVRVTALADPDPDALAAASRRFPDARALPDWLSLLEDEVADAILVALPAPLHAAAAEAVLRAGLHLYLEKPVATTLADGARVQAAANASDATAMVGLNYRFNPLFANLREVVRRGELGQVIAVRSGFCTHGHTSGWRSEDRTGAGVLLDLATHHADLIPHIAGSRITSVAAAVTDRPGAGDTVAATFELENGVLAQSVFSRGGPEQDTIEVIGEMGTAVVRRYESLTVEVRGRAAAGARRDQLRNVVRSARALPYLRDKGRSPGNEPSYRVALQTFIDCVRSGRAAEPGIRDGLDALAVVDTATRAVGTGTRLRLERTMVTDRRHEPTATSG